MNKCTALAVGMMTMASVAWADCHAVETISETVSAEAPQSLELAEADLAAAEKIFKKSCRACHGNKAQGAASYPRLSDKEPEYIAEKLKLYRAGTRIGPNSTLMIQSAKKLSDEDIANISVYVATAFD